MSVTAEKRAEELTAHISNAKVRDKAKNNLQSFLKDLEKIRSFSEGTPNTPKAGDEETTIDAIETKEMAHIEELKAIHILGTEEEEELQEESPEDETDLNARGKYGYTKLHQAVCDHDKEALVLLLSQGADPNIGDNHGATPLDKALNRGFDDFVEILRPVTIGDETVTLREEDEI